MVSIPHKIEKSEFESWATSQTEELIKLYSPDLPEEAARIKPLVIAYIMKRLKNSKTLDLDSDFAADIIEGAQDKYTDLV